MTLITKYNLGQSLVVIKRGFSKCEWVVKDGFFHPTTICTYTGESTMIEYGTDNRFIGYLEEHVFLTVDEAQAECDRLNQKEVQNGISH